MGLTNLQLFISFTPPFTLIEETFAIGCFRKSETKFVKINSPKKTFTAFVQINSCEKNIFHENKFRRKENYQEKDFHEN